MLLLMHQGFSDKCCGELWRPRYEQILLTLKFFICWLLDRHSYNEKSNTDYAENLRDDYGFIQAFAIGVLESGSCRSEFGTEHWSTTVMIPFGRRNWYYLEHTDTSG